MLDSLKHADGFAELFSRFGVFDGDVESALHAADEFGGESSSGDVEGPGEIRGRGEFFRGSVAEFDDVEFSSGIHPLQGGISQAGRFGIPTEDAARGAT